MPKLPLRYFLLASILIGAVAIPLGYKYFKARRDRKEAEIKRLTKELEEARAEIQARPRHPLFNPFNPYQRLELEWLSQTAEAIEARLEKLTDKKILHLADWSSMPSSR